MDLVDSRHRNSCCPRALVLRTIDHAPVCNYCICSCVFGLEGIRGSKVRGRCEGVAGVLQPADCGF